MYNFTSGSRPRLPRPHILRSQLWCGNAQNDQTAEGNIVCEKKPSPAGFQKKAINGERASTPGGFGNERQVRLIPEPSKSRRRKFNLSEGGTSDFKVWYG